ncbi:hypothetical protein GBAR_LOCUS7580 [Geodia barretti]|uniref:Uncharacterized protein n=1 Tax=Geodia barretti TaxID=519541 RepID=A0AA35RJN0_GEOBA|nr:hypothetical protein GBAR_LOCUS7580 [Geodia barretti]
MKNILEPSMHWCDGCPICTHDEKSLHELLDDLRRSGGVGSLANGHGEQDMKNGLLLKSTTSLVEKLAAAKEKAERKKRIVAKMKSERKTLDYCWSTCECLVARHEKSLRMGLRQETDCSPGSSLSLSLDMGGYDIHPLSSLSDMRTLHFSRRLSLSLASPLIALSSSLWDPMGGMQSRLKACTTVLYQSLREGGGRGGNSDVERDLGEDGVRERMGEERDSQESSWLYWRTEDQTISDLQSISTRELLNWRSWCQRVRLESCVSEAQAELSALQLECRDVRERLSTLRDQLAPLTLQE